MKPQTSQRGESIITIKSSLKLLTSLIFLCVELGSYMYV